jgi:RNA polymerase sigma-70 factor, ECF subfamily
MPNPVEQAFKRHYADVYRFLRRRTGQHERAEDLTQEVFASAAAALPTFNGNAPPLAWLYTVAKRRFADEARRPGTRHLPGRGTPEFGPEVASSVHSALVRLPQAQQEVLVLKLLRGATFAEVADSQGTSEAAAKMRFVRALYALRDELAQEGVEP